MSISYSLEILPYILEGLQVTIKVFVYTVLLSLPLGIILGIISTSSNRFVTTIIQSYTWIFRGTPLLLQLYFGMYGLPIIGITLSRIQVAIVIFTLNYGAYFTEIFRGSILSISKNQEDVSDVLGFTKTQTYFYIIIPQALKRSIQVISNELITLIKDTALVAAIALNDILRNAKEIVSRDFRVEAFILVASLYLLLSYIVVRLLKQIEKRYAYYR